MKTPQSGELYSERMFAKKLHDVDGYLRLYHDVLKDNQDVPLGEDIALDKVEEVYGGEAVQKLLDVVESEEPSDDERQAAIEEQMAEMMEMGRPPMPPPGSPEAKRDEEFRNACNIMGSMTASQVATACNLYAMVVTANARSQARNLIVYSSNAQLALMRAMHCIMPPNANFPEAVVYAQRGKTQIGFSLVVIDEMCALDANLGPHLNALRDMARKAVDCINLFIKECRSVGENPMG